MPSLDVVRETKIERTPRVQQLEGMFDVPRADSSREEWRVHLPIEDRPWNVGLIVGPSGSGKTSIARDLFGDAIVSGFDWPVERSVVDGFPSDMPIKEIVLLLNSVGFSSPPAWLRPFGVLSNGQQFRVTLARALAEMPALSVIDEFTSVVDRTVAQIGSAAVAKAVRRRDAKFVAVSCHYDIVDWLQPDWTFEPATLAFDWRCLQRHPGIQLDIHKTDRSAWRLFKKHHYLSADLAPVVRCFLGVVNGEPAAFCAAMVQPTVNRSPMWRMHRTVVLPDYQGCGIGGRVSEEVARIFLAEGKRFVAVSGHPALNTHRARSPLWRCTRRPKVQRNMTSGTLTGSSGRVIKSASDRLTCSWEFVGP